MKVAQPGLLVAIEDKVLNPLQFKNAFANCLYAKRVFNDAFKYGVSF
jgi:hypothetical protein